MTFTVLARDTRLGLIGAATASKSFAVGSSVIAVDPTVGAVASQAWTNQALRGLLLDELRRGVTATEAVTKVPSWDDEPELRQVSALAWHDPGGARSGSGITSWAGQRVEASAVFTGNLLVGPEVIEAMAGAWASYRSQDASHFAATLIAVLAAGDAAGGDTRGRQSAAVLVASRTSVVLDRRVDDDPAPLEVLAGLAQSA